MKLHVTNTKVIRNITKGAVRLLNGESLGLLLTRHLLGVDHGRGVHEGVSVLTRQLLESLALSLGDEQTGEDTAQHEQSEDLHNMLEPGSVARVLGTLVHQRAEDTLGNDGTDLAGGGRDTVGGGTVAGGEALAGHDEGGSVGAEVEEELGNNVETQQTVVGLEQGVVGKADDDEENGEDGETHQLDGLAANGVDGSNGHPVTGNSTSTDQDQVTNSVTTQGLVDVGTASPADSTENDRVVETKTVESCRRLASIVSAGSTGGENTYQHPGRTKNQQCRGG